MYLYFDSLKFCLVKNTEKAVTRFYIHVQLPEFALICQLTQRCCRHFCTQAHCVLAEPCS